MFSSKSVCVVFAAVVSCNLVQTGLSIDHRVINVNTLFEKCWQSAERDEIKCWTEASEALGITKKGFISPSILHQAMAAKLRCGYYLKMEEAKCKSLMLKRKD